MYFARSDLGFKKINMDNDVQIKPLLYVTCQKHRNTKLIKHSLSRRCSARRGWMSL